MKRCQICGSQTSAGLVGKDSKYSPNPSTRDVQFCQSCFDQWALDNDEYLLKKIKEKLTNAKTEK